MSGSNGTNSDEDPYIAQREADLARFAKRESGNSNITQLSGGPASGYYQMEDSSRGGSGTWETAAKWAGLPELPGGGYGRAMDYLLPDVPDMTPEEHQRVGDLADELFRGIKRRAGNNG